MHRSDIDDGARGRARRKIALFVLCIIIVAASNTAAGRGSGVGSVGGTTVKTVVAIRGTAFSINGVVTFPGTRAEGLLLNSRMVQAAFDDENRLTATNWRYPDTGRWSADRNAREFATALPEYAARGLNAVTINLQGGSPTGAAADAQKNVTTAFNRSGSLKRAWRLRLEGVIDACARNHIVVIVGLFYFGQDHRLRDERAVVSAVDNATRWLVGKRYTNVLVEIDNEANLRYDHAILTPERVQELIRRVQRRSRGRLKVSTSFAGGTVPPEAVIRASDFVLLHGNGQSAESMGRMVDRVRGLDSYGMKPKPIVFNEDSTNLANLEVAVGRKTSWGYYDQGSNDYRDGFQTPPVNWSINTSEKRAFFDRVASLTGKRP